MSETKIVKGFKVFKPDWTCRGKKYTCSDKFEENVTPVPCKKGMHFCKKVADCFSYYDFSSENHVAEVVAYGDIAEEGDKCCTNKIEIVREIPWTELLVMVNTGDCNTGLCNTGNRNTGNRNTGNQNSGDWNTGNYNTGNYNTGNWNTGDCNIGDYNTGDCNKCSYSNGCFNTASPKIYLFNKLSEWTYEDWLDSEAYYLLNQISGGVLEYIWWHGLSDSEKKIIKSIPNFDKEIFKEITGIDVGDD